MQRLQIVMANVPKEEIVILAIHLSALIIVKMGEMAVVEVLEPVTHFNVFLTSVPFSAL